MIVFYGGIADAHNNIGTLTECRIRIDAFQCDDRRNTCIVE